MLATLDTGNSLSVVTRPYAFSAPRIDRVAAGRTIADIVYEKFPGETLGDIIVELNGEPIPMSAWHLVRPKADQHILIFTKLHGGGGGGGGKNPLRTILTLVVVVVAAIASYGTSTYLTAPAMGWSAGAAAAASGVVSMAVMTAGMFLVNALAPIAPPDDSDESKSQYSLSGARNTSNPWGPIPVLLGTHRVFPKNGAKQYSEVIGNDEWLRLFLVWGYSPIKIDTIKIGDTPLTDFDDYEIKTIHGFTGETVDLYPGQVDQVFVGVTLRNEDGWVSRTVVAGNDELSVDISFPYGLMRFASNGDKDPLTVDLDLRYRPLGETTWTDMYGTVNFASAMTYSGTSLMSASGWYYEGLLSIYATYEGTIVFFPGTGNPKPYVYVKIGTFNIVGSEYVSSDQTVFHPSVFTITRVTDVASTLKSGLVCSLNGSTLEITAGSISLNYWSITDKSSRTLRYSRRWHVDSSKAYEVAMRRITADATDTTKYINEVIWTDIKGYNQQAPITFPHPLTVSVLMIKATEQLSGYIDSVNAVCHSVVPIWNGSTWTTGAVSNNPAALYRYVLICNANARKRLSTQLDGTTLGDWYDECVSKGYEFNEYRDYRSSIWELLLDIAIAGRAAPDIMDGLWSVIMDVDGKTATQHFTPRNSWGFSSEKVLFDAPHAFRVPFFNELNNWEQDERIVYDDGYDSETATLFETIQFKGITHPDLIYKHARFHIAQARLRPETYTLFCDFEHLVCRRGHLVKVAHDVPLWGGNYPRVKELVTDAGTTTGVVFDDDVVMSGDESYCCRFRLVDNTSLLCNVVTATGSTRTVTFASPMTTSLGPQVGDLAMFGQVNLESVDLIVKNIYRASDISARLELVDAAPAVHTADQGTIPDFDPHTTAPADLTRIRPAAPVITSIDTGTEALDIAEGIIKPGAIIRFSHDIGTLGIARYHLRYRNSDSSVWESVSAGPEIGAAFRINTLVEGWSYYFKLQAESIHGIFSDYSNTRFATIVGESQPPADVENFRIEVSNNTAFLSWSPNTELDLSHYKIKFIASTSGAVWNSAATLYERVPKDSISTSTPARQGSYLIKAIDLKGHESDTEAIVVNGYGDILDMNVIEVLLEDSDFLGTHERTSATLGVLSLADVFNVLEVDDSAMAIPEDAMVIGEGAESAELSVGYYYFANSLDLLDVYTCRLTAEVLASGIDLLADLFMRADFFEVNEFFGDSPGNWDVIVQVRITNDDPSGTPNWSDWMTFTTSDFTFRACEVRAVLYSYSIGISPGITELDVVVDMPDRIIADNGVVCPAAGLRVDFSPPFLGFSGIGFAYQNLATGDYAVISNKDETGFNKVFYNASGATVERIFDFVAKGHGRKVTI